MNDDKIQRNQKRVSDYIRGFVSFGLLLDELSSGVDCEQPSLGDAHLLVGVRILQKRGAAVRQKSGLRDPSQWLAPLTLLLLPKAA